MTWLWFLGGLVVLILGGELLVRNASALALKANVPPLLVGLTIVAMGTSAPELFASLQASWHGNGAIAVGNVLGSNVANLGLALGLTVLVRTVHVQWSELRIHWWVMVLASVIFMLEVWDLNLGAWDGGLLLLGASLYLGGQIMLARRHAQQGQAQDPAVEDLMDEAGDASKSYALLSLLLTAGCVALYWGSDVFVTSAKQIAMDWGVSTHVVGVTVVAFGTSVPEIAASLTAALRGNSALSIGNLVGSNILNLFLVLGATASSAPLDVSEVVPAHDMWWMLGAALLLAPMILITKGKLGRGAGIVYIAVYVAYVWLVVVHG